MDHLKYRVLVLSKTYFPIGFVEVKEAIKLVCLEKAKIMDENFGSFDLEEWFLQTDQTSRDVISTVSRKYTIPEVIRLCAFDKSIQYTFKFSRQNVFYRDQYTCQYCNTPISKDKLTIDHVIPKSRFIEFNLPKKYLNSWENVVSCCQTCNVKKDNKTPEEAEMPLIKKPSKPNVILRGLGGQRIKPIWEKYIGDL